MHRDMKTLYIKRHDDAIKVICKAITKAAKGGNFSYNGHSANSKTCRLTWQGARYVQEKVPTLATQEICSQRNC
jgi:hypothetical protein